MGREPSNWGRPRTPVDCDFRDQEVVLDPACRAKSLAWIVAFICTCSSARAEQVKSMFVLYAKSRVKRARRLEIAAAARSGRSPNAGAAYPAAEILDRGFGLEQLPAKNGVAGRAKGRGWLLRQSPCAEYHCACAYSSLSRCGVSSSVTPRSRCQSISRTSCFPRRLTARTPCNPKDTMQSKQSGLACSRPCGGDRRCADCMSRVRK